MSPPRLRESEGEVGTLVRLGSEVPSLAGVERARLRQQLLARVSTRRRNSWPLVKAAGVAACVVALGAVSAAVARSSRPQVELSAGAQSRWRSTDVLELSAGALTVTTHRPFKVVTPDLEVAIAEGRAAVDVAREGSTVEVFEGSAVASRAGQRRVLWAPAKLEPEPLPAMGERLHVEAPSTGSECAGALAGQCLEREAAGSDWRAQVALLRLALLALDAEHGAEAEQRARLALERFPDGVVTPEAHLVLLQALARLHRGAEARREATWYLEHQGQTPAASGVALLLGDLAMSERNWSEAREAYLQAVHAQPAGEPTAEAWYGVGVADERLGRRDEALKAFRSVLEAAPTGPRGRDAAARLQAGDGAGN